MSDFSVAIVGLGRVGHLYDVHETSQRTVLSHVSGFRENDAFRIVGGVDTSKDKRQLFESRTALPSFSSVDSLLDFAHPDVLVVSTPSATHVDVIATVASKYKPKVILCEKPLGSDLSGFDRLRSLSLDRLPILVNYPRRADPEIIKVRSILREHLNSTPLDCVIRFSKGLVEGASHFIDLLAYLVGGDRTNDEAGTEVLASLRPISTGGWFAACEGGGRRLLLVHNHEDLVPFYSLEILTPRGRLQFSHEGRITWSPADGSKLFPTSEPNKTWQAQPDKSQSFVTSEVLRFLTEGSTSLCRLTEAEAVHLLIERVQRLAS